MPQNAYFLAKIGADTTENERNFVDILPKIGNYPTGRRAQGHQGDGAVPRREGVAGQEALQVSDVPESGRRLSAAAS